MLSNDQAKTRKKGLLREVVALCNIENWIDWISFEPEYICEYVWILRNARPTFHSHNPTFQNSIKLNDQEKSIPQSKESVEKTAGIMKMDETCMLALESMSLRAVRHHWYFVIFIVEKVLGVQRQKKSFYESSQAYLHRGYWRQLMNRAHLIYYEIYGTSGKDWSCADSSAWEREREKNVTLCCSDL